MNTKDIIFVHGWGEDSRIWADITKRLPEYNHHFIDLGFINRESESNTGIFIPKLESAFYVTHSLGTLWVLNHIPLYKIGGLAAINGFGRFTDFVSNKTLKIMDKSLQRDMFLQMEMFWKNCNFPQNMQQIYKPILDGNVLSQGLIWLESWDRYEKLQELKAQSVPVLSLGGEDDLILPPEIMRTHWEDLGINLVMKEQAGHALPLTHPQWCAEQVKEFLDKNSIDKGELS